MPERVLPRDFPTTPELIISLSNAELQELGTFVAIWSQIDFMLLILTGHITNTNLAQMHLMMETMTTGVRVGLLTKLCQRYGFDHQDAQVLTYKEIKKLL